MKTLQDIRRIIYETYDNPKDQQLIILIMELVYEIGKQEGKNAK